MSDTALDGRVARGERTRRRVAEGLIALLEDGVAEPTARQVAERAGVSPRIVFHHYDDMEQVLRAAVAIQVERHWRRIRPVDPSLALTERVSRLVRQRGALFDAIAPVRRAAALVEPRSPTVAAELGHSRSALRRQLEDLFARELAGVREGRSDLLDALDVASGWEAWDQFRHRIGQPASGARRVMARMLLSLLDPSGSRPFGPGPPRLLRRNVVNVLRTPDERFSGLPGYPFAAHYTEVPTGDGDGSLRVHYLDEGDPGATETIVLLHGEPSWSFLYRRMVPPLADAGFRVVAPDLVGFGRSDKPAVRTDYTYARHVEWMRAALFDGLGLSGVTIVGQDWGGLVGLRLVAEHPDRFRRVVAANTGLPTGDTPMGDAFMAWQSFSQEAPELPVAGIVGSGCTSELAPEVRSAYDAPFPDESYKEGARQFPILVPTRPDDPAAAANRQAWEVLEEFDKPFLCAYSDSDPITRGADQLFLEKVPGAKGQRHPTITGGGHFLQEDRGPELAAAVIDFVRANPGG